MSVDERVASQHLDETLARLTSFLGVGRALAVPATDLAAHLEVNERTVGALVAELIDRGWLIGSTCSGDRPGYFLIADELDLDVGTRHIRSRAISSLQRVSILRRNARDHFSAETVARLFDVEGL